MKILGMLLFPTSSVAKKILMAISGLMIFGFLLFHLVGNLFLFKGQDAFNAYAHKLASLGPLLYVGEVLLGGLFLYHALQGVRVTLANKKARKHGYGQQERLGKGSLASKTMAVSGGIILIFLVVHIYNFRLQKASHGQVTLPKHEQIVVDSGSGVGTKIEVPVMADDLYSVVASTFTNAGYVIFYVIAMICMGLHLMHAGQSALRTLGLSQPKYLIYARVASIAVAAFFVVGFCSFPVYFLAKGGTKADPAFMPSNTAPTAYVDDVEKTLDKLSTEESD